MDELINRVAQSNLITFDLESLYPQYDIVSFDIKPYLFHELILKEKDFRAAMANISWESYQDKILCVYCSNDAIIPVWAYMVICSFANPYVKEIFGGNTEDYLSFHFNYVIKHLDISPYTDARIVIKGCSNRPVPFGAYMALQSKLQPVAQSIMYGEPCSTVPIFKRPRKI